MKGNQGLDALAALCGGATKAEAGDSKNVSPKSPAVLQPSMSKKESMLPEMQCTALGQQNCGQNTAAPGTPTPQHDTHKWQTNHQIQNQAQAQAQTQTQTQVHTSPYISTLPNVAAILSAAGSVLPQQGVSNISPQLPSSDPSNAIQQLAYINLLQNQASSTNQMISHHSHTSQNGLQSSAPYSLDPNTAMAIVLAVQQQAQQAQQLQQAQHVQQQHPQLQHTQQQNQQAQIQQPQNSPASSLGMNNAALFPTLQTQNKINDQQQHQQRKQYHQIVPTSAPAPSLQVEADKECMKPPALPFIPKRPNATSDVSVSAQSAITSASTTRDTQPQEAPSVDNDSNGVTTSKVGRPVSLPTPLHQPILMRRPHLRKAPSSSLRSKVKDESDSSPKSDDQHDDDHDLADGSMLGSEEKKQMKRAANRRSAQLSRKRKKQFIEELNKENDELRRKEQILRSIPDLVLVFDSAGKLWFVSHSVTRFLKYTPTELEGTSLWDRLCDESVRLLKSAFMDALAARTSDSETTPLGSGVWELRMQDKDGTHKWVMLNGVVHFSGDAPECVCSVRPRDRLTSSCNKPSLLSNALDRKGEMDISKDSNVARVNDQHSSQPSIQTHQPGQRISSAGRFVQISDSSSIISE